MKAMKAARATLFSVVVLLGVAVTADAFAQGRRHHGRHHGGVHHGGHHHHGGVRFGLFVGAPFFGYYGAPYYYPPYSPYYYPRTVVVPSSPPVYVEQGQVDAPPMQPQAGYWYYCRQANAYYPYVEQCAEPWERVPPRPAS
jgi:hypothetical protein